MTDRIEFTPTPADLADAQSALHPKPWGRYERLRLVLACPPRLPQPAGNGRIL